MRVAFRFRLMTTNLGDIKQMKHSHKTKPQMADPKNQQNSSLNIFDIFIQIRSVGKYVAGLY